MLIASCVSRFTIIPVISQSIVHLNSLMARLPLMFAAMPIDCLVSDVTARRHPTCSFQLNYDDSYIYVIVWLLKCLYSLKNQLWLLE